jgi:NitT/TauT family transport system permease protein
MHQLWRYVRLHPEWVISPLLLVVGIAVWDLAVEAFDVDPTLVPGPQETWAALRAGFEQPLDSTNGWYHTSYTTLVEALGGFVIGSVAGILIAFVLAQSRLLERVLMPYLVGFQALPKVAIAPLFVIWFGLGMKSKIYLGATITFFPVLINTMTGFTTVDRESRQLMRSYRASRIQVFRFLQLPYSLPHIFAGLEIAIVFSLVAAIVGEFLGGSDGLGAFIQVKQGIVDTPSVFAALIILSLLGIALYGALRLIRRRLLFWAPADSSLTQT